METAMGKTRLVSLGARVRAEDGGLSVRVGFADTDTGATMVAERGFAPSTPGSPLTAETISGRLLAPGITVAGAARGQVLSSVARRRADGLIAFGAGRQGRTTLMPRAPVQEFWPPLRAVALAPVVAAFASRPISLLRPRNRAGDIHVFDVEAVLDQAWMPGAQVWHAAVQLPADGGVLLLRRAYDAGTPGAIDVMAAAAAERYGPVRQVTGTVRVENGYVVCDPWSLGADRFIVPDLDRAETMTNMPVLGEEAGLVSLLDQVQRFLAGALHAGHPGSRDYPTHGAKLAAELRTAGFVETGDRLAAWLQADGHSTARIFGQAAVWLTTLLETQGNTAV